MLGGGVEVDDVGGAALILTLTHQPAAVRRLRGIISKLSQHCLEKKDRHNYIKVIQYLKGFLFERCMVVMDKSKDSVKHRGKKGEDAFIIIIIVVLQVGNLPYIGKTITSNFIF